MACFRKDFTRVLNSVGVLWFLQHYNLSTMLSSAHCLSITRDLISLLCHCFLRVGLTAGMGFDFRLWSVFGLGLKGCRIQICSGLLLHFARCTTHGHPTTAPNAGIQHAQKEPHNELHMDGQLSGLHCRTSYRKGQLT